MSGIGHINQVVLVTITKHNYLNQGLTPPEYNYLAEGALPLHVNMYLREHFP